MDNNKTYLIASPDGIGAKTNTPSTPENETEFSLEIHDDETILCLTEKGFGFRFNPSDLRVMDQDSPGVAIIELPEHDSLFSIHSVRDNDIFQITSSSDNTIEIPSNEIPILPRGNTGVRLIKLEDDETVTDLQINN